MVAWTSLPIGVVTLAERFGGRHVTPDDFEAMVAETQAHAAALRGAAQARRAIEGQARAHARHLGHRDDGRRHPPRAAALRPQPRRRLLAQRARRARRHLRSLGAHLRGAHRRAVHRPRPRRSGARRLRHPRGGAAPVAVRAPARRRPRPARGHPHHADERGRRACAPAGAGAAAGARIAHDASGAAAPAAATASCTCA